MATLRRGDGLGDTTPHLRGEVERLQRALRDAGHEVEIDGLFSATLERAVRRFQSDRGLEVDGIVGPDTWRALRPHLPARERRAPFAGVTGFETFHGDLDWVHAREGHAGKAYWPGGRSGVTLDPGFDLGYQDVERTQELYASLLSPDQLDACAAVSGVRGTAAKAKLAADPTLRAIRISRAAAGRVMPYVAVRYWTAIGARFPVLREEETPGSVQTALLSLAYNRGARNGGLAVLKEPLIARDWLGVADRIAAMQQDHELQGIRTRRRREADLIREELQFS